MDLNGLLAISGHAGLFKTVKQARNSIIVESLTGGKRMPAYATSRISALEDIAVYTNAEDVPLAEILKNMYKHLDGKQAVSPKSSGNELKEFFALVLPDYDQERVYVSDIKRIISWYNLLQKLGLVDLEDAPEQNKDENAEENSEEKTEENKSEEKE